MSNRDTSSFLTGLLVGAVVGLAIGFLYAPKSGKETREMLKEKAAVLKEKATEVVKKVKQTAGEATPKV
jgi:gas vesicle protein